MAWYPPAIKKPVARFNPGGRSASKRSKGRGTCNHVAVSEAASLYNYFNTAGNPCSHFYVRRDGIVEQYVDTDYVAPCNLEGNWSLLSLETQGGANEATVETEPWTSAAVAAIINLHVWLHKIDGFPLRLMTDSKPATKGIGWHELGVEPHVVTGGELWSSSYGKVCPGNKKIEQIRTLVLPGCLRIAEGDLSMADAASIEAQIEQLDKEESDRYIVYTGRHQTEVMPNLNLIQTKLNSVLAKLNEIDEQVPTVFNYAEVATRLAEQLIPHFPEINESAIEAALSNVLDDVSLVVTPQEPTPPTS